MAWLIPCGLRANEPGGYALPRSSRQTRMPASESRRVFTDPPKPEPTTIASKCSSATSPPSSARLAQRRRHELALDAVGAVRDRLHRVLPILELQRERRHARPAADGERPAHRRQAVAARVDRD